MKKMFALLLAAMMLLAMVPAAMATSAYTPVTPGQNSQPDLNLNHILTLKDGLSELFYEITYTFTTGSVGTTTKGIKNLSAAVEGTPKIAAIVYSPDDTKNTDVYNAASKSYTKPLSVNWTGVSIKEPGVYYWPITKNAEDTDTIEDATNIIKDLYLYVVATDNGGTLTINSVFLSTVAPDSLAATNTKGNIGEQYPAQAVSLTLSKTVSGSQGSKDQYFMFQIKLTSPANAPSMWYDLTGNYDLSVPTTAYNDSYANPMRFQTGGFVTLWLKDGQSVTINNMLSGTSCTIIESNNDGYHAESSVTVGSSPATKTEGSEVSIAKITASTTVAYTNTKEPQIPTGIELETTAPIVGMMLAMALLALLFVGKRKEEIA